MRAITLEGASKSNHLRAGQRSWVLGAGVIISRIKGCGLGVASHLLRGRRSGERREHEGKAERRRGNGDRGSVSRLPPGAGRGRRGGHDGGGLPARLLRPHRGHVRRREVPPDSRAGAWSRDSML